MQALPSSVRGRSLDFPLKVSKAVKDDPKIAQPEACDLDIVPKVAFRWMFSGPSNSGKTNLARWVLDKYYIRTHGKTFFDRIYLFSPTGKLDPVWKDLDGCRPSDRITELTAHGKERLHDVFDAGLRRTKAMGKDKAPHELVIFDDAIADVKFLNSADFLKVFVAGRHGNISCMVMTQSYVKVPRSVRMQITALAMFPSRVTEIERLCDEHGPVDMSKRDFIDMVKYAIAKTDDEKYPFFFLDTALPEERRFRRGLNEQLVPNLSGLASRPSDKVDSAESQQVLQGMQEEEPGHQDQDDQGQLETVPAENKAGQDTRAKTVVSGAKRGPVVVSSDSESDNNDDVAVRKKAKRYW